MDRKKEKKGKRNPNEYFGNGSDNNEVKACIPYFYLYNSNRYSEWIHLSFQCCLRIAGSFEPVIQPLQ